MEGKYYIPRGVFVAEMPFLLPTGAENIFNEPYPFFYYQPISEERDEEKSARNNINNIDLVEFLFLCMLCMLLELYKAACCVPWPTQPSILPRSVNE